MTSPDEYQRLKDIVSSLPSLPINIPPDYNGKSWPKIFSEMLQKVITTLDDGKMIKILQKEEEASHVSLFCFYHI